MTVIVVTDGKGRQALELDNNSLKHVLDTVSEGLYILDRDRRIIYWNRAAERIAGFSAEEMVGSRCSDNMLTHIDEKGNNLCVCGCPVAATLNDGQDREEKVYLHHKEGHRVPVLVKVIALRDKEGQVVRVAELFKDLRESEATSERIRELEKLALLDKLTNLPNRRFVEHSIFTRIEEKRRLDTDFGVLFMDIDNFKVFNDTYGHDVGDKALRMVAGTFLNNGRSFDLYGRWGGEEFIGIIRNVDRDKLVRIGERMRKLVGSAYMVHEGRKLAVTLSIGATLFIDNDTQESLVRRADALMYESKKAGKNRLTLG